LEILVNDDEWKVYKLNILSALDIKSEYEALGVQFTTNYSTDKGWLTCRIHGRTDEKTPGAGVNIGEDLDYRGRYKEFSGDGRSLSLFDAAIEFGKFVDFKEALKYYAQKSGKSLPRGRPPETPATPLTFKDFNRDLVANWCRTKLPIVPQAVQISGGQIATYDTRSKLGEFTTVAFPFFGPKLLDADPCGWACYSITGRELPLSQGKDQEPKMLKVLTMRGSVSGFVGRYGLSILDKAELVWKVEGITDMLAIQSMILKHFELCSICGGKGCARCHNGKVYPYIDKHIVLTTSGGAAESPSEKYTSALKGKRVFVVHDQDETGECGTEKWFTVLSKLTSECRAIRLPFPFTPTHGQDVRDYFNQGKQYSDLLAFADDPENIIYMSEAGAASSNGKARAKPLVIRPVNNVARSTTDDIESLSEQRRMCEVLGIQVVGEDDKMRVEVFSIKHGKTTHIQRVSFLTVEELVQICGEQVLQFINQNNFTDVPGTYRIVAIKRAIAALAGYQRANDASKSGLGCWHGLDSQRNRRNSVVVVGGHEGFEWNSDRNETQRIRQPIYGGLILDFKNEDSWYHYETISAYLHLAGEQDWSEGVIAEAIKVFKHWNWKYPKYTPTVIAGLVLASFVQTLWDWRPLVALTGPSSAGKSTMFETLDSLFGGLGLRSSKSSEAGIRQGLGNNASVLLCDEFESDSSRQKILELFRTSTKGDKMLKGTTDQKGQKFGLQHICWIAAIETGLRKEPDRNRFIQLDLRRLRKDLRGSMAWMPTSLELNDLGMKLLAIAIRHVHNAMHIANEIRSHRQDDMDGRVIESYAIPVSMLAAVHGNDVEFAAKLIGEILGEVVMDTSTSNDESELLNDIFGSIVDCGGGVRTSVAQALLDPPQTWGPMPKMHLEKSGIAQVSGFATPDPQDGPIIAGSSQRREMFLFLVPSVVDRVLLRDTRWRGQDIAQIIKRIPGAEKAHHRIAQRLQWGVRIPWTYIVEHFVGDSDTPKDLNEPILQKVLNYDASDSSESAEEPST
jgi:hypothetical protein